MTAADGDSRLRGQPLQHLCPDRYGVRSGHKCFPVSFPMVLRWFLRRSYRPPFLSFFASFLDVLSAGPRVNWA
ncbi:hypothetical protein FDG2_5800 [Candidatus Protofrankia californiensis]|uniref:Uncharacterized protein n=1 Tax=Candidatus Protofrankia californiensis TaxID=1839754 RepID=A0A1C3PFN4_9ACTN|nr:hypothetical protein FDG2_5800 [Candidatus Protofrankia californiensis]